MGVAKLKKFKPGLYLMAGKIWYIGKVIKDFYCPRGTGHITECDVFGNIMRIPMDYDESKLYKLRIENVTQLGKLIYGIN